MPLIEKRIGSDLEEDGKECDGSQLKKMRVIPGRLHSSRRERERKGKGKESTVHQKPQILRDVGAGGIQRKSKL